MALENTYTDALYNSYFADVDAISARINTLQGVYDISKWKELDNDIVKENVLLKAIRNLNSFDFIGSLNSGVVSPYNMKWPRTSATYQNGVSIGDTEIPQFVLDYCASNCIEILDYDEQGIVFPSTASNVKKQKVGSLEQEFFSPSDSVGGEIGLNDFPSYAIIEPYIDTVKAGNLTYLQRA